MAGWESHQALFLPQLPGIPVSDTIDADTAGDLTNNIFCDHLTWAFSLL